jgi:hypothetical protein
MEQAGSAREWGAPEIEMMDATQAGARGGDMGVSPEATSRIQSEQAAGQEYFIYEKGKVTRLQNLEGPDYRVQPNQIKVITDGKGGFTVQDIGEGVAKGFNIPDGKIPNTTPVDPMITKALNKLGVPLDADIINTVAQPGMSPTEVVGKLTGMSETQVLEKIKSINQLAKKKIDQPKLVLMEDGAGGKKYNVVKDGEIVSEILTRDLGGGKGQLQENQTGHLTPEERVTLMKELHDQHKTVKDWEMQFDTPEGQHQGTYTPDAFDYEPLKRQVNRAVKKGLEVRDLILDRHGDIAVDEIKSHLYTEGIKERIPEVEMREAIPFIIEEATPQQMQGLVESGRISQRVADIVTEFTEGATEWYRGSRSGVDYGEFDFSKVSQRSKELGGGIFFTEDLNLAHEYAGEGGKIQNIDFKPKNPQTIDAGGRSIRTIMPEAADAARAAGHDALIIKNVIDTPTVQVAGVSKPSTVSVAFEEGVATILRKGQKPKPNTALAKEVAEIKKYYKSAHKFLAEHHDSMGFVDNYVNRLWDLDKASSKAMGNYFSTNMPNAKGRTIPSLVEGIEAGYRPKTLDIAELISVYDSYKIKTSYNARFARGIFDLVDPEIGKLLNTYNRIPQEFRGDFVEFDHHALKKAVYRGATKSIKNVTLMEKRGTKYESAGEALAMVEAPIIEQANVWAHKDIAPFLNNIFGKKVRGYGIGYLEGANAVLKKSNLAFSLFHHVALTEAGAGWGVATKAFVKSIKGMKEGKPYAMSTPELQRLTMDAVKHTVRIDPIPDHHVGQVQNMMDRMARSLKDKSGTAGTVAEALAKGNKYWDSVLWDYYHSTMKLMAYEKGVHTELGRLAKDGTLMEKSSAEISKIKREVAQFVNDSFGGQVWETFEHLGNPKVQQVLQLSFLSPDWTLSTIRQAQAAFAKGPRGRLGRKFWIRSAAIMFSMIQAINYASSYRLYGEGRFTWSNPKGRKTYALLPWRGKNGEELYLRIGKQFREAPEMVTEPLTKVGGKLSPLAQIGVEQFTGASPGAGFPAEWKRKPHESETLLRLKSLAEKSSPFALRSFITGQQAPLAGSIPISKGMSAYTARQQLVDALRSGKSGEELESLKRHILQNKLDYNSLLSQAKGEVTKIENFKYKKMAQDMINKISKGAKMLDVLEIEREKSGLKPREWRRVMTQFRALKRRQRAIRRQQSRMGLPDIGY